MIKSDVVNIIINVIVGHFLFCSFIFKYIIYNVLTNIMIANPNTGVFVPIENITYSEINTIIIL